MKSVSVLRALGVALWLGGSASAFAAVGDVISAFGDSGVVDVPMGSSTPVVGPLVQADGKIVVCALDTTNTNNWTVALYRFDADGSADTTFGDGGSVVVPSNSRFPQCEALGQQSDGRIIAAATGTASDDAHDTETQVYRFDAHGAVDAGFGEGGVAHVNFITDGSWDFVTGLAIAPNDAIVVSAPLEFSFGAVRLDADGHPDPTFASGDRAVITFDDPTLSMIAGYSAIAIDPQGRIVMTGTVAGSTSYISSFAAVRLNADGSPDATFGSDGLAVVDIGNHDAHAGALMLDASGRIVIVGDAGVPPMHTPYPNYNVAVVRLADDGALDASFGDGGLVMVAIDLVEDGTDGAAAGVVLGDGKLLVVGGAGLDNGGGKAFALQLGADGTPDPGFGTNGLRLYSFVSEATTHQAFTGIGIDGASYAVVGSLDDAAANELGFVTKLGGNAVPLGHSTHARFGPNSQESPSHAAARDMRSPERER